eukprot:c6646_g1_i1.p1 GENE.c6646_g1_i1~~c6646_g1_i1.p1  ORF type:complete len:122 (+),score=33.07 c6646_g1_i1:280-645(+)
MFDQIKPDWCPSACCDANKKPTKIASVVEYPEALALVEVDTSANNSTQFPTNQDDLTCQKLQQKANELETMITTQAKTIEMLRRTLGELKQSKVNLTAIGNDPKQLTHILMALRGLSSSLK